jgi:hypothetical protein
MTTTMVSSGTAFTFRPHRASTRHPRSGRHARRFVSLTALLVMSIETDERREYFLADRSPACGLFPAHALTIPHSPTVG